MRKESLSYPLEWLEPWDIKTRKRHKRNRKPTLTSVAKQAAKAGLEVARYDVDESGKISVVIGKPISREITRSDDTTGIDPNEWN